MKKTIFILAILFLVPLFAISALADAAPFDYKTWENVDYDVYVTTPDGGLHLRSQPNLTSTIEALIPDYVKLHITGVIDGIWGETTYNGLQGFVYLAQTSKTLDETDADYDVIVKTPDGGLNLRTGPGTNYDKLILVPDDVTLHIFKVSGGTWGETTFNGVDGWVFLGQTSAVLPADASTSAAQPASEPPSQPSLQASPSEAAATGIAPKTESGTSRPSVKPTGNISGQKPAQTASSAPSSADNLSLRTFLLIGLGVIAIVLIAIILILLLNRRAKKKESSSYRK